MEKSKAAMQEHNKTELNGYEQTTLDIFRIAAALMVMVGHSLSFYKMKKFVNQEYFPCMQYIGVIIFILLSGFLTTYSLSIKTKAKDYSFKEFFIHKVIRISREYIPGLVVIAVVDYISIRINGDSYRYYNTYNIKQFVGNIFMLQGMGAYSAFGRYIEPFGSARPLWTIAVEWWLYMLYGALYIKLRNKEEITLPKLLLFLGIVFMVIDYFITGRGNGMGFVFALGILGYYCYKMISVRTARIVFILSCLLYVCYGIVKKEAYTVYSFVIIWLILCSALRMGKEKDYSTRNPFLAYLSKSTFMLYLIHYSIIDLIAHADCGLGIGIRFVAGIIASLGLSLLLYLVFGQIDVVGILIKKIKKRMTA